LEVDKRATDVCALLAQLRREIEPLVQRKPRVRVVWDTPVGLPELRTDGAKLKVVLKNLITNALKFTDEGSVTIATSESAGSLAVEVADTGEGIPPDQLSAIFEPFRQVDGSSTRRHDGVGLGLHIVRRYVDLLGGEVSVKSDHGRGSVFRVLIPSGAESLSQGVLREIPG
jgi:signal transduction histidine kinase